MSDSRETSRSLVSRRRVLGGSAGLLTVSVGGVLNGSCARIAADGPLVVLTVIPMTSMTFAPELFADAAGYFENQGLEVTFETTRGSAQSIQLVLANRAGIARVGRIEVLAHAANRGAPLVAVATPVQRSTIRFVSSAAAPLRVPADFQGRVIGLPSAGGESEITLDLCLANSGIARDSVTRQIVGVSPAVFDLVIQGHIDGYAVSMDAAKILLRQRHDVVEFDPGMFVAAGAQVYVTSRVSLVEQSQRIRKYLAALRAAIDFIVTDSERNFEETLGVIRTRHSFEPLNNDDLASASLREYVAAWTADGRSAVLRTNPGTWRRGYVELVDVGQAAAGLDPLTWYTNELLPRH